MSKTNLFSQVATAIIGIACFAGTLVAQECSTCETTTLSDASSCDSCESGARFGNHRLGSGQHQRLDEFKAQWRHQKALNATITARNDAWFKPFACADRQLYFAMWEPMIDQGFENQCVLTSIHFDVKTHELNRFGQQTVAGIMQTMPSHRKEVFIYRDGDAQVNASRLANVTTTIETFYGQTGPARVSYSSKLPIAIRGRQADAIARMAIDGMQPPIIPITSGESVNSSVGN